MTRAQAPGALTGGSPVDALLRGVVVHAPRVPLSIDVDHPEFRVAVVSRREVHRNRYLSSKETCWRVTPQFELIHALEVMLTQCPLLLVSHRGRCTCRPGNHVQLRF